MCRTKRTRLDILIQKPRLQQRRQRRPEAPASQRLRERGAEAGGDEGVEVGGEDEVDAVVVGVCLDGLVGGLVERDVEAG